MSNNLVGQIIANQFRVDAFISAGGMGAVFRVWDLKRNVPLAMKVLHADLAEDQVMFERFKREARALRKLEHPNIVPFYGLYQVPSLTFLLERYIDGPTLKEVLAGRPSGSMLRAQHVLSILKALCSAVGYAHSNNVIHCDIKAANVMIDKGGHIYLGDFGIARHAESDVTAMPGAGTPAYMAPEQILGSLVTQETDIYALGVLLFELLTGQRPFRGNEVSSERSGNTINERIRFAQLNLPAPDPRVLNAKISPAVSAIVLRTLEKDPSARFTSCQELFLALCQAYGTRPEQIPDRLSGINISQTPVAPVDYPDSPAPSKTAIPKTPIVFIGGALVLVLVMVLILSLGGNRGPSANPLDLTKSATPVTFSFPIATSESQSPGMTLPTNTEEVPIEIAMVIPTSTYTPVVTEDLCPEGMSQKFKVGDTVRVCTGQDRLILRSDPSSEGREIFRMYPGVKLVLIGDPQCGVKDTWWQVSVKPGSWVWEGYEFATTVEEIGWVREGGRGGYDYFICPVD